MLKPKEQDSFINNFIEENNLKNNPKNKNIIKMAIRGAEAKSIEGKFELKKYLKDKFL